MITVEADTGHSTSLQNRSIYQYLYHIAVGGCFVVHKSHSNNIPLDFCSTQIGPEGRHNSK